MGEHSFDPDLLERLINEALEKGASYAEARFHVLRGHRVGLMNGEVFAAGYDESVGVGVRVIVDGGLGFAATTRLDWEGLSSALEDALRGARLSARLVRKPISMADSPLGRAKYRVWERIPLEDLSLEDKLRSILEHASGADLESGGLRPQSFLLFYNELFEHKIVVNSDGGMVEATIPRAYVAWNLTAASAGERRNRFGMIAWSGGFEGLERENLRGELEDDARSLAVALLKAKPGPKGVMDVVLSPELVGIAVHESIGHPSEADRILGREAAQAGLSYWRELKPGDRLGSEHATVVDDPTLPGTFGFYLYDDETVPARPRYLLYKGIVTEMLQNRETAAVYGVQSNGAARARDYGSEPIVRMANTYFKPGDYTFEELVEDVREGVYIRKFMEWNIDDYRWGARYVGLEAYEIRNGRIGEPVKDVVLEITSPKFYSSVDAVARDFRLYPGFCGKGEPMQGVPVTMGGPHIRLRGVPVR